jgi:hypothetical protein
MPHDHPHVRDVAALGLPTRVGVPAEARAVERRLTM